MFKYKPVKVKIKKIIKNGKINWVIIFGVLALIFIKILLSKKTVELIYALF